MGVRFRKSINLGKFIRINLSKSGIGASIGVPGARITTGPYGNRLTLGIPGTGLSYQKEWGRSRKKSATQPASAAAATAAATAAALTAAPPDAPQHEAEFAAGISAYREGQIETALTHFRNAAAAEPGAALLAAALLTDSAEARAQAIALLENLVQSDSEFPTPLMQRYLDPQQVMPVDITPYVTANVPVDGLLATLLLVELYQAQGRVDEAIGLLEEIDDLAQEPAVTLSLCELYAEQGLWEGVIERASDTESLDDVTLETMILYGRAMQAKGLHDAAIHVLTTALRRKKDRSEELLREARYWRAISYRESGQQSRASKELQTIYAEAPDFRNVADLLGV
jgi:tetratricopeptide (TPR) repeat protein